MASTMGVNLSSIKEKFPNFESDYNKSWRAIVKKRLATLSSNGSVSSKLTGVKEECRHYFPYLTEIELTVIQDRISGMFRNSLGHPDWDPWKQKLPKIFEGSEINPKRVLTVFETSSDGTPQLVSQIPKTETFTVMVTADGGDQVFRWSGVPKDIAMTSISEITKALA